MSQFVPETYLFPHICFDCRLSFKRVKHKIEGEILCPNCRQPAHIMARKFQVPPRYDVKGWEVVRLLYQNGWRGYGWNVSPQMSLRDVEDYLKNKPELIRKAKTKNKQAEQNEKWRKMRKWPIIHVEDKSSTR